jgi:hypothetical protein
MPASFRSFLRNGAAFGGAEGFCACLSPYLATFASKGNVMGITGVNRFFERRAIHLLTDGLFYHLAGYLHEVAFFAGAFRHAAMMTRMDA